MTNRSFSRRSFLLAGIATPVAGLIPSAWAQTSNNTQFANLELSAAGRLGVYARDTANGHAVGYRQNERFPMCSTVKVLILGAILQQTVATPDLLGRRVRFAQDQLVPNSPVTEKRVADGMTVMELCQATAQYSDNAAANMLLRILGGPQTITSYARAIGDQVSRLDRWEPDLNSATPGDAKDTTTPSAMARSVQRLALDAALPPPQRQLMQDWLKSSTTGAERIRAALPAGWTIGDKTGSGAYGTTNDVAVIWPPNRAPIVLAIYFTQPQDAKAPVRNDVVANAAKIALKALGRL